MLVSILNNQTSEMQQTSNRIPRKSQSKNFWSNFRKLFLIFAGICYIGLSMKYMPQKMLNAFKSPAPADERLWWFLKNGALKPKLGARKEDMLIWPEDSPYKDRVLEQLMTIPEGYDEKKSPVKTILVMDPLPAWFVKMHIDNHRKILDACPVSRCSVTRDRSRFRSADAVVFLNAFKLPPYKRPRNQIWIYLATEPPYRIAKHTKNAINVVNWTSTHRQDSDIPILHGKWFSYDDRKVPRKMPQMNYAANKTRQVVWVLSNYEAYNDRMNYTRELQKYISVDVYGGRINKRGTGPPGWTRPCPGGRDDCFKLLGARYKFYLSFENSNCKGYITEKLFQNALENNMVPVVMGARPKDYALVTPPRSYIHVDDFASPKELARFLNELDTNDNSYNTYFRWKGTGEFINQHQYQWCNLCAKLHGPLESKVYFNLTEWIVHDSCIRSGKWPQNA